jgi:hypothetical protein
MAPTPRKATPETVSLPPPAALDFSAANTVFESWLRMQRQQLDTMIAWQRSMTDMQQDLWDRWVSHWAGGVPLDG